MYDIIKHERCALFYVCYQCARNCVLGHGLMLLLILSSFLAKLARFLASISSISWNEPAWSAKPFSVNPYIRLTKLVIFVLTCFFFRAKITGLYASISSRAWNKSILGAKPISIILYIGCTKFFIFIHATDVEFSQNCSFTKKNMHNSKRKQCLKSYE